MPTDRRRRIHKVSKDKSNGGVEFKERVEYCIDTDDPIELLTSLPSESKVLRLVVRIGSQYMSTKKTKRPSILTKLGCTHLRETVSHQYGEFTLENISRVAMIRNIKAAIAALSTDPRHVYVKNVLISNGETNVSFQGVRKEIR